MRIILEEMEIHDALEAWVLDKFGDSFGDVDVTLNDDRTANVTLEALMTDPEQDRDEQRRELRTDRTLAGAQTTAAEPELDETKAGGDGDLPPEMTEGGDRPTE